MPRIERFAFVLLLAAAAGIAPAAATTAAEVNSGFQFNLSTPGARSLAMGGSFLALADDATAAFTNPAGLTILSDMEASIEGRRWDFTNVFSESGGATGPESVQSGESESDVTGLSFLSFVYPGERWAVAAYGHQLANFETEFATEGPLLGGSGQLFPTDNSLDLEIVNFGVSGAFEFNEHFSAGLGVSVYDLELTSSTARFNSTNFVPANQMNIQRQEGDDTDVAFNVGFLYTINSKWRIGVAARQGPEFDIDISNALGTGPVVLEQTTEVKVPSVYGLGVSFQPTSSMTITFDYDRVEYSVLTEDITDLFSENPTQTWQDALDSITVDDGNEFHLGFEYVFLNIKFPIAARAGVWHDPAHNMAFEGDIDTFEDLIFATLFREGDDEIHYSAGAGIVFGQRFQVDFAADFSELVDTISISSVVRF
jgi:long-subunit fatty acid transport protein